MRGEYPVCGMSGDRSVGSSPHAWGILCGNGAREAQRRFIPTCVGNTLLVVIVHDAAGGSSPHAWGIPDVVVLVGIRGRFIPTCVGNTSPLPRLSAPTAVHPHMRGEYADSAARREAMSGSSPHAWGIRQDGLVDLDDARFIPTCVGNTNRRCAHPPASPVHPHMRGEYRSCFRQFPSCPGSSPHAWGIRTADTLPQRAVRFIPTCVGNTLFALIP